jgi:hypothetical protein
VGMVFSAASSVAAERSPGALGCVLRRRWERGVQLPRKNDGMSSERRLDSVPLRAAMGIFCTIACYFGVVLVISLALTSDSEPRPFQRGPRPADLQVHPPTFVFDYSAQIDLGRRLTAQHTVPIVLLLGVVAVALIAWSLISRYRSWRSRRSADPERPQWMIR